MTAGFGAQNSDNMKRLRDLRKRNQDYFNDSEEEEETK